MNHQFKFFISTFIWIISIGLLSGQSAILDQYVEHAWANNLTIKSSQLTIQKQENQIQQAKKLWTPSVDLSASYLLAQGGRNIVFPIGDLFNPAYGALNQLTGTNSFPTNLENENIQLTPNNFIDAQLSVSRPLINSTIKYNELIQKEILKIKSLDVILTKQDIKYQVKNSYFNHLKAIEGLEILSQNEELLNEVLDFNKKLVKYDKATSEVISDVEYQIEALKSQKTQLIEQIELSKSLFNLLLNQPLSSPIMIDNDLIGVINYQTESIENLTNDAINQRQEFEQISIAQAINDLNIERINKEKLPTLGINAGVGLQTEDFNFDAGGPLFTLGLGMKMNILDGGMRKKRIEAIAIEQEILSINEKRLTQQVEIEIIQSYLSLQSILSQLQSQEAAIKSAMNSYNLTKTRYENDKAILIELLQAQNRLITSQFNTTLIKYDYLSQKALLEKSLGI